jgi:hypothetical protein
LPTTDQFSIAVDRLGVQQREAATFIMINRA